MRIDLMTAFGSLSAEAETYQTAVISHYWLHHLIAIPISSIIHNIQK